LQIFPPSFDSSLIIPSNINQGARDDVKWWDYQNAMATTPLQSRGGPSDPYPFFSRFLKRDGLKVPGDVAFSLP